MAAKNAKMSEQEQEQESYLYRKGYIKFSSLKPDGRAKLD